MDFFLLNCVQLNLLAFTRWHLKACNENYISEKIKILIIYEKLRVGSIVKHN